MDIQKKKNDYNGDFIKLVFANEEEYTSIIELFRCATQCRKDACHGDETDVAVEESVITAIEKLKTIEENGVVTSVVFADKLSDLFGMLVNMTDLIDGQKKLIDAQKATIKQLGKTLEMLEEQNEWKKGVIEEYEKLHEMDQKVSKELSETLDKLCKMLPTRENTEKEDGVEKESETIQENK